MIKARGCHFKLYDIEKWCRENCESQHSFVVVKNGPHRGPEITKSAGDFDAKASVKFAPNCCIAFENELDPVMYALVWSE